MHFFVDLAIGSQTNSTPYSENEQPVQKPASNDKNTPTRREKCELFQLPSKKKRTSNGSGFCNCAQESVPFLAELLQATSVIGTSQQHQLFLKIQNINELGMLKERGLITEAQHQERRNDALRV
jgi:hypothetical protein